MSAEGSAPSSFRAFWNSSTDKLIPKKFKFVPKGVKQADNGESGIDAATIALNAKQHRRAQVRKAQIEHRQRKANYVKHLEQDIIDLREMITGVEIDAILIKNENDAIRAKILNVNIPIHIPTASAPGVHPQSDFQFQNLSENLPKQHSLDNTTSFTQDTQDMEWLSELSGSSLVTTIFDDSLSKTILRVSPAKEGFNPSQLQLPEIINSPDLFSVFPPTALDAHPLAQYTAPSYAKAPSPQPQTQIVSRERLDLATIAMNFILALEHPCRTHFHAHHPYSPAHPFDPTGSPSGHELMASTILYSSAPSATFTSLPTTNPTWISPLTTTKTLSNLEKMSRSLPKEDWEVTPVQAWFLLVETYGGARFLSDGVVENLKARLGELVGCFAFGAVMNQASFWEVVWEVLGEGLDPEL